MKNLPKTLLKLNLLFIFIFLNIWDFLVSREFLNAMSLGILMFSPATLLWLVGTVRAAVLITLISVFQFMMIAVFIVEGFELGGLATTLKSLFWAPYLLVAGINGFFGLKIYSEYKEKKVSQVS